MGGMLLWLEPAGWSVALVLAALPRPWHELHPAGAAAPTLAALRLLVLAAVLCAIARRLPRRTQRLMVRWQEAVARRGGESHPAQPVYVPSLTEQSEDPTREPLRTLQNALYAFMRAPGTSARRWLTAVGAVMALEIQWELWLGKAGGVPRSLTWGSAAADALLVLAVGCCALALLDVRRGRVRSWRAPWRAQTTGYPAPWTFQPRATRLPSLPIVFVLLVVATMWEITVHASTVSEALDRGGFLLMFVGGVWACRDRWGTMRPLETSWLHHRLWRALASMVRVAWYAAHGAMTALAVAIVLLLSLGLAGGSSTEPALEVGIVLLGLRFAVAPLVRDWRRPIVFLQASSEEIAARTRDTALDRRVTALLGLATAMWAAARFL